MVCRTRGASIEAPRVDSVACVAKGNKIILDFVYLCPPAVPCRRKWLVLNGMNWLLELTL